MDFTNRGPLVLISHFQTPRQLAAAGQSEVYRCLRNQKVRHADRLAATAIRAAATQHTSVVSEATAAELIARLAQAILDLDRQLAELDSRSSSVSKPTGMPTSLPAWSGSGLCSVPSS